MKSLCDRKKSLLAKSRSDSTLDKRTAWINVTTQSVADFVKRQYAQNRIFDIFITNRGINKEVIRSSEFGTFIT